MKKIFLLAVLLLASSPATACEEGHWIEEVAADGEIIILEDGSVWKVDPYYAVDSMLWLPVTTIIACSDRLINTDDGEVVGAVQVR